MKKYTSKYPSFLAALLVFCLTTGCSDFVDLNPPTIVRQDQYFKTQADFTAAVNGLYGSLRAYYGDFFILSEIPSDNTESNGYNLAYADIDQLTWLANNSYVQSIWLNSYSSISRANIVLDRIDGITMDNGLKERYKGEAKFIRALMYFNLVQFFGEVPLVLKEVKTEAEAYTYSRDPVGKVYSQIETDLQEAISALPLVYTGADQGRASKGAAQGLLGKVYITRKQFDKAVPVLENLISAGNYTLLPKYEDVFRVDNPNNKELVFSVQYLGNGNGEGSPFSIGFAPAVSGTDISTGGVPAGRYQGTLDLLNAFEPGDLRKAVAIAVYPLTAAPYTRKFIDRPIAANEGNNDWPVLRYPDVLLLQAEALNQTGETNKAVTALNVVRQRAGLPGLAQGMDKNALHTAIQKERRVELCFEGHRWFDLIRNGNMVSTMAAYKEKYLLTGHLVTGYKVTDNKVLYPIPFRERSLNPNLTQNVGYE